MLNAKIMRLTTKSSTDNLLDRTPPNAGLRVKYDRKLVALLNDIQSSIVYWVSAQYKASTPEMAMDASPAVELNKLMRKLTTRWQKRVNQVAQELATNFARDARQYNDISMEQAAKKAGMTVKFKMTPMMNDAMQAVIGEQVGLIKSIAQQHLSQVQRLVMQSVQEGRDLKWLTDQLKKRYGVSARRASLIALDQNNKATATLNRVRQLDLMGDDAEAVWMHSTAGKHPRPEHVAANGKRYKVKKGMFLEGEWVWPGSKIKCRCTSRLVIVEELA
jgi:SPP1 gp7 family putative phage head morphogenesis protein